MPYRRIICSHRQFPWAAFLALWAACLPWGRAATPAPNEVVIVAAIFGADSRTADVTAKMAELVHPSSGNVKANLQTLGIDADLAPDTPKELRITYKYRGVICTLTFKDGQTFNYKSFTNNAAGAAQTAAQTLTPEQLAGVVFIQGDKNPASGFFARVHDTDCVVTNLHVLAENQKFTIKNQQGEVVGVQGIIGAVGADIALLRLVKPPDDAPHLDLATDVLRLAHLGDNVVVVGNGLAGSSATQTTGRIKGIGPDRVEVDAAFQPGHSGSPIFDMNLHQVVGVATFAESVKLDATGQPVADASSSALFVETRWLGYRLDSVAKWESIDWTKWREQIQRVDDFRAASLALAAVCRRQLTVAQAKNVGLRTIFERYKPVGGWKVLAGDATDLSALTSKQVVDMLTAVRAYAGEGEKEFAEADYYDYFHHADTWSDNVSGQVKYRDLLIKRLQEIAENLSAAQRSK
jgi:S1-C subfamily serine protease